MALPFGLKKNRFLNLRLTIKIYFMDIFKSKKIFQLDMSRPICDRVLTVAPLVVIGTKEGEEYDIATKNMVTTLGFDKIF